MQRAFSLVELSIVLVILGLLVGGILAGQSLIRAAELRSVSTDIERFRTASYTFRDKYFALPGDMNNGTAVWGYTGGTGCTNSSGTASTSPGTCDGNNDSTLGLSGAANQTGEGFQFWRQLTLAGLLEGNYSGNAGALGARDAVPGTNTPRSRLSNAGYAIEWRGNISSSLYWWNGAYGNAFTVGTTSGANPPEGNAFKPEEAWNIDTKVDDGKPATGRVRPYRKNARTNCTTTDVEATTDYLLTDTGISCNLMFISGF